MCLLEYSTFSGQNSVMFQFRGGGAEDAKLFSARVASPFLFLFMFLFIIFCLLWNVSSQILS